MSQGNVKNLRIRSVLLFLFCLPFLGGWTFFGDSKINVTCSINGYGSGKCTFTNTGDASGKECGNVFIAESYGEKEVVALSETICSGKVESSSSVTIDVSINAFKDKCAYSESCVYSWKRKKQ